MLVSQLAFSKANDGDQRNFDTLSRWSDPWQHPIHADSVSEFENHFVDQLVLADGARNRRHFRVGRHLRNEPFRVEFPQFIFANTTG